MKTHLAIALSSAFTLLGCALTVGCSTTNDDVPSAVSEAGYDAFFTLRLTDIEGRSLVICDKDTRGVLFLFASHTCPIANAYAPRIQQIYNEYSGSGIRCLLVQVDPIVSDEQLARTLKNTD